MGPDFYPAMECQHNFQHFYVRSVAVVLRQKFEYAD